MRLFFLSFLFVFSLNIVANISANEINSVTKNIQEKPIIKAPKKQPIIITLHGTIVFVSGNGGAIISINNEKQKYIKNNTLITKDTVLERTYSNYVLLKTSNGLKKLTISPRKTSTNEEYYDPNIELGQTRKFYQPPLNAISLNKTNDQKNPIENNLLKSGQTRQFYSSNNSLLVAKNYSEEIYLRNDELTEGQSRTLYYLPEN